MSILDENKKAIPYMERCSCGAEFKIQADRLTIQFEVEKWRYDHICTQRSRNTQKKREAR